MEVPEGLIGRCCFKGCKHEIFKIGNKKFCDFHKRENRRLYMVKYNQLKRPKSKRIYYLKCELCGNKFIGRKKQNAKWCSRKCKQANATIVRSERKIKKLEKIIQDVKDAYMNE